MEYTVSIPKETIYAMHRLDICNEELSFSFTGGGGDLQKPLIFYSSSLNEFRENFKNNGVCGELRLYYKLPVELSLTPSIQLMEDGVVIKEVPPILTQEEDRWILTADFENTPVNSEKKYSVILPEGTLVMQEGITVNQRKEFFIGDTTSISEIEDGGFAVSVDNGVVTVDGIAGEGDVRLYTLDGKQIFSGVAAGGTVSISVSAAGVCILSVDGKTQKITVK